MSRSHDVIIVPDADSQLESYPEFMEDGVVVPFEKISPETLRNLISEFVSREWECIGDSSATLDDKISQVMRQLIAKQAKVVFDLRSETCNIVVDVRG